MPTRTGTQSIDRASQLLVHVVEDDEAPTVGELAQLAGLPKSTTSRLVGALERQGLVQRDPARRRDQPGPGAAPVRASRDDRGPISSSSPGARSSDSRA